ncbi:hypothetical protein [Massilia cavernae]|uniref:Uncharacterized protein n=1 Tax=Massilia cavernae TaxID=2320864 RepID=A0A418XSP0_9BURK|nr:hypothetical protein [Massilia cavernae]RJG15531.1 hypothetical protein D3872_13020 [Massilia cavernae]
MIRPVLLTVLLLSPQAFAAAPVELERREATPQEVASFKEFYVSAPGQPVFSATRAPGARAWEVGAVVSGAPYRGLGALCRATKREFAYDARAPKESRWSERRTVRLAWLDRRAGCPAPARPAELAQRIPDAELIPLMNNYITLLQRARLLFSGNTSCAPLRSDRFALRSFDVSAPPFGKEELHGLVFENERGARATVWVKKRGAELLPWDVACSQ